MPDVMNNTVIAQVVHHICNSAPHESSKFTPVDRTVNYMLREARFSWTERGPNVHNICRPQKRRYGHTIDHKVVHGRAAR